MLSHRGYRPTVLLTGFGPFPGVTQNVSGELVEALAQRARDVLRDHNVVSQVLPTEWARVPELAAALHAEHRPVLALHFGVAREATGFRLETTAVNLCRASLDANEALPAAECLIEDGIAFRKASIDVAAIAEALRAGGYPVSISDDAGSYLCNALLYHSLTAAAANQPRRCRVGFVHIPADLSQPPFALQYAVSGALEILNAALEREPLTPS